MASSATGLTRIINAAGYSLAGLRAAFRNEAAFRQELLLVALAVPLAFWLGDTGMERALMIGAVGSVLVVELLNSAVESVVDRIGPEHHELAGRAKDLGSAAVLVCLLLAAGVWGLVLFG